MINIQKCVQKIFADKTGWGTHLGECFLRDGKYFDISLNYHELSLHLERKSCLFKLTYS